MKPNNGSPVLAFEDVSFIIEDRPILSNVSFTLSKGETLVVQGAAGSGKTVLMKIALGLYRPTSGRVFLFGEDVSELDEQRWYDARSHIGVLFQEGGLFDSLTVEENVAYPLRNQLLLKVPAEEVLPRVEQSLQFVELGHTLEKYPSELSGGMRRRAGIARAIVTQPDLLLYDSPTAGLDPITANTIVALIVKGRDVRGAATLMVTHRHQDGEILAEYRYDQETASLKPAHDPGLADRTRYLVLRDGAVAFLGSQEDFDACQDPYVEKFASR
jgi:phospholipid/cholesterol/gamma-HCH transport system ATP-binding protein